MRNFLMFTFCVLVLGAVIYKFFIYYDPNYSCFIKVIPSLQPSNWDFNKSFKLLKQTAPDEYVFMCKNIDTVSKDVSCGGFDGGCYYTNKSKTIYIGNDQDNIALNVAIIIHEICHVRQFSEGRKLIEQECYAKGADYLDHLYNY